MSVGLLLAQCDGGGSQGPWSHLGWTWGTVLWCSLVSAPFHPTPPVPARHDIPVAWGVCDAAGVSLPGPWEVCPCPLGSKRPLANLAAVFPHCSCRGRGRNTQPW